MRHPHLDHMNPEERYEFLSESGDVDDRAALEKALSQSGVALSEDTVDQVLEALRGMRWQICRPYMLSNDLGDDIQPFDSAPRVAAICDRSVAWLYGRVKLGKVRTKTDNGKTLFCLHDAMGAI